MLVSSFLVQSLWGTDRQLVLIYCRPALHFDFPVSFPLRTWYSFLYSVWLGSIDREYSSTGREYYVSRIAIPNKHRHTEADIALLKLSSRVTFSPVILPICLPNISKQLTVPASCWVTGWGQNQEGTGEMGRDGVLCSSG